ncbi:MAG: hypothetical protein A2664_01710 [Candidatus Taylorbacteria bacterium RIFCSPHIGHO2_01_FULL_46_22b]|uniref:Uncharacterized protein n=1 Tax=Candidatus Taylorbacteria bacterium RIFCSPHIGHO2_01_FULL_46_22b TaxID=1802301 RepID=A0A1G2M2P0_9BACT|nr:MAG: hypothetical protein A2664_01710 [Candidatus Taylorbacteria bacterium RIFCSPHIGHO2_01_FULL_46_22b]
MQKTPELIIENEQEVPQSLELVRELEVVENQDDVKLRLGEMLDRISSDVGALYEGMRVEQCLARVEQLSRVLETIELGKPLHISDETDSHYANAVIPAPEGIKIALSEGEAPGSVRAVVGFGKTLIGFKTDHLSVSEIDFAESEIRDANERKYLCRHVSGDLLKDDIHYLILRIPYELMPAERLTVEEKKKSRPFVFRGMRLGSQ